ncbi:olfactory receptor 6N1-like [Gopherus evgoodei]|uniref:olfactory receptor 6N1-like n=1 Tax=Gopherus evgoodei TaxID=1825980 RepID=UPI0011CF88F9|nr:olfactory receptor 6N1-like [Gopherus evgoodei]
MEGTDWRNQTTITELVLLGFRELPDLRILLFLMFLVIYMATMAGNTLIVMLVVTDQHLHTPMYLFLGNLSYLEICYTSTFLSRLLACLLTGDRTISVSGCITQLYFSGSLAATECYLLAAMSYDRYLAICKPLHYSTLMSSRFCLQLTAGAWLNGCLATTIFMLFMSPLIFYGPNEIDHFYCDPIPLIKRSCSDTLLIILMDLILICVFTLSPFLLTLTSYVRIIATILKIPSTTGRQKAFSTCSSHLLMVTIFYGTVMIVYMLLKCDKFKDLKKVFSLCYTVLIPLVNPLIYSLRNRKVKEALCKATVWERLGSDLWESVAHGSKEAVSLSQIWCKTKKIVETLAAEVGVQAAVDDIFRPKKAEESPMVLPEPPVVLPVGAKEFFGGEDVIVPTAPGFDPDVDPHTVPLPQDSEGSFENMDTDRTPFTESTEFREEMKRQGHQLQEMLDKLSRMAGETSSPQSHLLKTLQGYENYKAKPPDKPLQSSNNTVSCPRCGLWGCSVGCTGTQPQTPSSETQPQTPSSRKLPGRSLAGQQQKPGNPFLSGPPAYSPDTVGPRSPDPVRRWRGLIKEAHIEGEFLPNAFPVITPDPNNPTR